MWSFFSRDPTKDFHYDIGEKVTGLEEKSIWSLHHGKKKGSGEPVSVFTFDVKASSESQIQLAKSSLKRIKTLRHPNIVTFLDGVETDKVIYYATEPVIPLETYLNEKSDNRNELAISWGLHQIAKGLSFLINDCKLIHNNVCMSSIFVTPSGEWKLGGVDYMYPAQGQESIPPVKILPALDRYDPPEKTDLKRGIRGEKWSSDMWGLGCLIWEVFSGQLCRTSDLKSLGKIPKSIMSNYCELVGANPKSRPNPAKFIDGCRRPGGFMKNSFVDAMLFMEEIQIKDQNEKTKFFGSLAPSLDTFPQDICVHKILPQLLYAFEYGAAGSAVLAPLFKIGKLLNAEEYQKKIVPCVVKLFGSTDRATRVKLLQQVDTFVEYLQPSTVNDQIFPHIIHGFTDTNPVVRETTIKAMLYITPKLNYKNLNEEVMKHFARLQSKDDQGGIRTNTTVCLGKIACYLSPQVRQKMITSAFLRALKDPFPPARQAGILGMASTQNFYYLNEIAQRLLPSLCSMLRDPDKGVRDQAFKAIKGFLTKLEKVSENADLEEDMEKDVMSGGSSVANTSSWTGWAVTGMSSITSKLYKKNSNKGKPTTDPSKPQNNAPTVSSTKEAPQPATESQERPTYTTEDLTEEEENAGDGWDDDDNWGDIDSSPVSSPKVTSSAQQQSGWDDIGDENEDDEDDDNWGSLEDTPSQQNFTQKSKSSTHSRNKEVQQNDWGESFGDEFESTEDSGLTLAGDYDWGDSGNTGDDFFSSVMSLPKKKPQNPGQTKSRTSPPRSTASKTTSSSTSSQQQKQSSSRSDTGWGEDSGWGNDDWDGVGSTNKTTVQGRQSAKSSTKQQTKSDSSSAGWDTGWSDDSGWGTLCEGTSKIDEARKRKEEREEKRLQRQKELQEKREARKATGALKLGAKKLSSD